MLRFLACFLKNRRDWAVRQIDSTLDNKSGIETEDGHDLFEASLPYLRRGKKLPDAEKTFHDILSRVFQAAIPGELEVMIIKSGSGEVGLRISDSETYFGLLYIGNISAFKKIVENEAHYRDLLDRAPLVETPDMMVNEAMDWSVVSLDQLRIRNPNLGYGLVSGYSGSGAGTRPKYCWFFEEPTLTSWAYHRVGLSRHVKESLRFLQRYQREDGKTAHEVSQSLEYQPDFFETYAYAYMHSDGPVYFLAAYVHYLRCTGDHAFIREQWPKILKTLHWCIGATDPSDGLIQIEPGDWGSAESSTGVWKDTQLAGMWVFALNGMETIAALMDDDPVAAQCAELAVLARASIETKLWNPGGNNYHWGLDRSGRPYGQSGTPASSSATTDSTAPSRPSAIGAR